MQILDLQPGASIYDPTAGTGGMLISALDLVQRRGGEHRTLAPWDQYLAVAANVTFPCTPEG